MAVIKSGATTDNWTIDPTSKAGRVSIYDAEGHPIDSSMCQTGEYHLGTAIIQDVITSVKNTNTSLSIAASGTWNTSSNFESTMGISGIQICSFLTQAHTITLYQSMDDLNFDITDSYDVPANYGVGHTFQAVGSGYYVKVTNKSGTTTATGRIATFLCPTVEALPRSLTRGGNLKVSCAAEWQSQKQTTGLYTVNSPQTIGSGATPQNLFVLSNPSSIYWIAIRSLHISSDSSVAFTTLAPVIRVSRGTTISGGTSWTANIGKYQTSAPTPQATCLVATTADNAALTTITATAGSTLYEQSIDSLHTAVGLKSHVYYTLVPETGMDLRQFVLVPGEALLVQATVTAMLATTSILINCSFSEMIAL